MKPISECARILGCLAILIDLSVLGLYNTHMRIMVLLCSQSTNHVYNPREALDKSLRGGNEDKKNRTRESRTSQQSRDLANSGVYSLGDGTCLLALNR
jgi:hypothetical protein